MRKPRADAVLLNLPEEQQAKLADWLLGGMPYHEARLLVEKEFGVALRSLDPFRKFWNEVCQAALLARRRRALSTADERAEEAKRHPGQFDAATLDALKQKAYELSEQPDANPRDVKAVLTLVLKARDQDLTERSLALDARRVALLEEKARQAGEAEEITKSELTAEEKVSRMREVFGIA
jgi:hypothetical protein